MDKPVNCKCSPYVNHQCAICSPKIVSEQMEAPQAPYQQTSIWTSASTTQSETLRITQLQDKSHLSPGEVIELTLLLKRKWK